MSDIRDRIRPTVDVPALDTLPPLPPSVETIFGESVDLTGPRWYMHDSEDRTTQFSINMAWLSRPGIYVPPAPPIRETRTSSPAKLARGARSRAAQRAVDKNSEGRLSMYADTLVAAIKLYMAHRIGRLAPRSVMADHIWFRRFECYAYEELRFNRGGRPLEARDLTSELLDAVSRYKRANDGMREATKGGQNTRVQEAAGKVAHFYRWCARRGYPGFDRDVARDLEAMCFAQNLRGVIAKMGCPRRGALAPEELAQVDAQIAAGAGELVDRAVVKLYRHLGIRPKAASALRRRHLRVPTHPEGHWHLEVPKSKQRGRARGSAPGGGQGESVPTRRRRIARELGELLASLPVGTEEDPFLFPFAGVVRSRYTHFRDAVRRWADAADLVTTRVPPDKEGWRDPNGPPRRDGLARLPLSAYRFRRTLATLLVAHGADEGTIAHALDDRTLAMATVYAENSPSMVDVLEATLDRYPEWVRVINLWLGRLATTEDETALPAVVGGAFQLVNYAAYEDIGVLFRCAKDGNCDLYPPLSCYRCKWARAVPLATPHRRQLAQVKEELRTRAGVESDRMVAIFERDAMAIVQVIATTESRRGRVGKVEDAIARTVTQRVVRAVTRGRTA